ncbi:hypothetical protein LTR17_011874 [Elasticomyces elasticus]|nr:hypothetical protein LTR17_011874 [Elasticomyces elasticus]
MARPKAATFHNKRKRKSGRCYLLELPPELRLQIYAYSFTEKYQVVLNIYRDCQMHSHISSVQPARRVPKKAFRKISALLRTCKTIATEGTPVLFQSLLFHVYLRPDFDTFRSQSALRKLHKCQFIKYIRSMNIIVSARDHAAASSAGERLSVLVKGLQRGSTIKLNKVLLYLGSLDVSGLADPVVKAIMEGNFSKGFELYQPSDTYHGHRPAVVNALVWQKFKEWSGAISIDEVGQPL